MKIPTTPLVEDELFARMESYREGDLDWRSGRTWGYVYHAGVETEAIAKKAFNLFLSENGLDPTSFPSLLRFENEVVAMATAHLHGDERVVGSFTSGGTESILLAVKTARDCFRQTRPEITAPEMILPVTGHAAFHKAAHCFDVRIVPVEVDPKTFKADPAKVREAITESTILLVGSAPSYAHGVVDPIAALGEIAQEHDLLLHVDACIGGFLLPYFERLGAAFPRFDFRVPGVTSISMDLHKYAYAPKGASVVLYRDKELRAHQFFSCSKWTGYSVVNQTLQSSKSGGPVAAAWAVLHSIGDPGYLKIARELLEATRRLQKGIEAIPGLYLLARPEMSLLAIASDEVNVFHVTDEMKVRGWYVQAQLGYGTSKENIHLTVAPSNVPLVDEFLADLRDSVEAARGIDESGLARGIQDAFASLDPSAVSPKMFSQMLGMAGINGVDLPERMADVNEVLNVLPKELSEKLIANFMNDLYAVTR
jgi:glutamate/tyrosine decarboxylase-like PLP-dependent enzyme